jgi:hypothetical protein
MEDRTIAKPELALAFSWGVLTVIVVIVIFEVLLSHR